jgi:hypothetical protein
MIQYDTVPMHKIFVKLVERLYKQLNKNTGTMVGGQL